MVDSRTLFEALIQENAHSLRIFLHSAVHDPSVVDDLFQETIIVAWKTIERFDPQRSFGPWIRGIARTLTLSHPRRFSDRRSQCEKTTQGEVVDDLTVRFFYEEQYAFAKGTVGDSLTVLPSHIYNLADPDNPEHDPNASLEKQGKHINENRHNQL